MKAVGKSTQQSTFITQIIYPLEKLTTFKSHAFLIGWNLEQFKCLVIFLKLNIVLLMPLMMNF